MFCLASGRKQGLDASPRGGSPGFVHVLDSHTIAFADWPGNNRIESMRNLVDDNRIGMLFLFPGLSVFMRINGTAKVSNDEALLTTLAEGNKVPKTAIVITINEVLFHCGKALNHAKLWEAEARIDKSSLPTPGKIFAALNSLDSKSSNLIVQKYDHSVKNELYG
ncbi:MSMEG_1061 family FMN-dependent PPOX-type flavoprotein [Vibrio litoralis]|uniref:MSMEG_1061 family FMN-dependent PPOX-type flavoprotein n=1 Tax=Vibrio litoralis TaxID=335972 RepID=UPI00299F865B|nr:MSMEG_1061 family FMN-dependent PPOX-type flavoprotein [Vibrio litoralis]